MILRLNVSQQAKPETVEKVCEIVRKQLALQAKSTLSGDSKFSALGADSLDTIQIWDLPKEQINKANVMKIGVELGRVQKEDLSCPPDFNKPVPRVRVEMDIKERLSKDQKVRLETEEELTVKLKYEKLEFFCFFCGVIGSDQYTCRIRAQHWYEILNCGGSPKDIKHNFTSQLKANLFFNGIAYSGKHTLTISRPPQKP
ncbi:hypothetical protein IFM89_006379 [Coptis chinensis]|uniref:Zinc knuckle CX2CX4HX4C domain-containing protein n=1 Tax=Coptis chinensis TaxID=261450 RepID=A0A835LTJ7_9MAGN|nr:hypothetical protein IFM89_006379 [Coptis chinensis]